MVKSERKDDNSPSLVSREIGSGVIRKIGQNMQLRCPSGRGNAYSNAQLDDYGNLPRSRFPHRPPLQLSLSARFSHDQASLCGTAGFGFWNDPFWMTRRRMPAPPQVCWFLFASRPSNLAFDVETAGFGWKAAVLDAGRARALLLAPMAPLIALFSRFDGLYRTFWPKVQALLGIDEQAVPFDMRDWHRYEINWLQSGCLFLVDGQHVLTTAYAPRGPLALVIWIDNQFMVATPQGSLQHGLVANPDQWLEVQAIRVRTL